MSTIGEMNEQKLYHNTINNIKVLTMTFFSTLLIFFS